MAICIEFWVSCVALQSYDMRSTMARLDEFTFRHQRFNDSLIGKVFEVVAHYLLHGFCAIFGYIHRILTNILFLDSIRLMLYHYFRV